MNKLNSSILNLTVSSILITLGFSRINPVQAAAIAQGVLNIVNFEFDLVSEQSVVKTGEEIPSAFCVISGNAGGGPGSAFFQDNIPPAGVGGGVGPGSFQINSGVGPVSAFADIPGGDAFCNSNSTAFYDFNGSGNINVLVDGAYALSAMGAISKSELDIQVDQRGEFDEFTTIWGLSDVQTNDGSKLRDIVGFFPIELTGGRTILRIRTEIISQAAVPRVPEPSNILSIVVLFIFGFVFKIISEEITSG